MDLKKLSEVITIENPMHYQNNPVRQITDPSHPADPVIRIRPGKLYAGFVDQSRTVHPVELPQFLVQRAVFSVIDHEIEYMQQRKGNEDEKRDIPGVDVGHKMGFAIFPIRIKTGKVTSSAMKPGSSGRIKSIGFIWCLSL